LHAGFDRSLIHVRRPTLRPNPIDFGKFLGNVPVSFVTFPNLRAIRSGGVEGYEVGSCGVRVRRHLPTILQMPTESKADADSATLRRFRLDDQLHRLERLRYALGASAATRRVQLG